ncbi:hypothetical protein ACFVXE_28600 [Streptomyces sp. NPDC058231]|uniref:HAAS signaling domain-containing protein n=1 Tax=Streptomyces sp. NPDC058231 TaxID=3346392 RepID=UPI0036E9C824
MKTDSTFVQDYLAAVERESTALPPAVRQELIADLGEHIQVALAERPGSIREILHEMGEPRTIVATALQELGHSPDTRVDEPRRPRSPAWLSILFLLLSGGVLPIISGVVLLSFLSVVLQIIAVVMVCRSRHWKVNQKWIGLALTVIVPGATHIIWNLGIPADIPARDAWRWALIALTFASTVFGCGWLWRAKRL